MNAPAEPFSGCMLSDHKVELILRGIGGFADAGRRTGGTNPDHFVVTRAGNHVLVDLPSARRFLLALRPGIPHRGGYPLGADDVEAAFLLPSLEGEPPPRKLVVPGTAPLRPMTSAELAEAADLYNTEAGIWNRHEASRDLPMLRDVIYGIRIVDTPPGARGLVFELLDTEGHSSGVYAAIEAAPGWRRWRSPLLTCRRATLTADDVVGGTWLINPVAHLAAKVRSALREVH